MDRDKQLALERDFPELCRGCSGTVRESLMAFGFEVGNGWEPIVRRMCSRLSALAPVPVLDQVKEKFGTLRVYHHGGPWGRLRWWLVPVVPAWWAWRIWRWRRSRDPAAGWPAHARHQWRVLGWHLRAAPPAERIVREAEAASATVCERCGAPGRERPGGWIVTLCDRCAAREE